MTWEGFCRLGNWNSRALGFVQGEIAHQKQPSYLCTVALVVAAAELFRRKRMRSSVYGLMGEKVPLETLSASSTATGADFFTLSNRKALGV